MAVPTAAYAGLTTGGESRKSPRVSEFWNITGNTSVDGDSVALTPQNIKRPQLVIGAVSYAISGTTVTVTLMAALAAAEVIAIEVVGYPA
jgi:hypothetical protein